MSKAPVHNPSAMPIAFQVADLPADAAVLVLTTAPDLMLAKYLAHGLVEDGVVACANLGASGLSMYMWQGEMQGDEEVPLTFKTTVARLPELAQRLRQHHPYELPEFLVLPVVAGSGAYLDWLRMCTTSSADGQD